MRPKAKKVSPRSGHVRLTVAITPGQLERLVEEATKRAIAAGASRADLSEVVREALEAWFSASGRRKS